MSKSIQGREYQTEQVEKAILEVSTKRKVLVQLPTGGGKTVEFALLTKRFILNTDKAVLILVHRDELLHQAAKTIENITGFKPYLITAKTKKFNVARVYVGMIESVKSRLNLFHNVGLVIIDEAHVANFNKAHGIFLSELVIGYSATPIAASKKEPLNKYYHEIVTGPSISELIKMGFLAQNVTRCPKNIVDAAKLEIDKLKGDYNEGQMAMEYSKPKHIMNLLSTYTRYCAGKKTIIFNVNIEHSKQVTDILELSGYNVRHLDGNTSEEERKAILHWFKVTPDAILCNVMIATVGFDEPTIECVILNFSTLSLTKFIQCAGRGGRIIDDKFISRFQHDYPYQLNEKYYFDIIDMGGNCIKFGDWNDDRDWKTMFYYPDKPSDGGGVAPVKVCPNCDGVIHAALRICPLTKENGELCNYSFEKKEQKESVLGDMMIITEDIDVKDLVQKNKHKYDYYPFFNMGEEVVRQLYGTHPKPTQKQLDDAFADYYKLCIAWWKEAMAGVDGNKEDISNDPWHITRAKEHFNKMIRQRQLTFQF